MRLFALCLLSTFAFANPPSLTPQQQAWVNLWVGQLNPSPQIQDDVRKSLEDLLLDGYVTLPQAPDPLAPMLTETTCNNLRDTINATATQCQTKKKQRTDCEAQVEAGEEVGVECAAQISAHEACQRDLADYQIDYLDGCFSRYPPNH